MTVEAGDPFHWQWGQAFSLRPLFEAARRPRKHTIETPRGSAAAARKG